MTALHSTRYLHCSRLLVRKGARVEQGQPIALVGSTGASSGPHLHHDHAVTMPRFRDELDHPSDLLEVGRALPGCGGRLAVPVEQLIEWVNDHASGDWPPVLAEAGEWVMPIDPARCRLGSCWYARRKHYLPGKNADGSPKYERKPDGSPAWIRHQGIDLAAKVGTEIVASAAGTVVVASTGSPSAGTWVVIEHD